MSRFWMLAALAACSFNEKELTDAGTPPKDGELNDGALPVVCQDRLEPNEDLQEATIVKLGDDPVEFTNLAVCPGTDQDVFFLPLELGNRAIDVRLVREGPAGVEVELLNSTGTTLGFGQDSGLETRLCLPDLPMTVFFARVSDATDTKYRITFSIVANCN